MRYLHLIPALSGTVAVYGDKEEEGYAQEIVGWATIELEDGTQYIAPMACDMLTGRVYDARDDSNFLRVTVDDDRKTPPQFHRWNGFTNAIPPDERCKCGSWDPEICAVKSNLWQETDAVCACDCHTQRSGG